MDAVLERGYVHTHEHKQIIMNTIASLISLPLFDQVQSLLLEGDPSMNKELLLVARHMGLAEGFGNFRNLTKRVTDRLCNLPFFKTTSNKPHAQHHLNSDPIPVLHDFFSNPLYCGAIIMSCFLAPLSDRQVEEIKLASYMKEINVMESDAYDENLDFSPFFGIYDNSLAPTVKPNPRMASVVHKAIDSWKAKLETKTFYPTMSRKLLPTFTRNELAVYIDQLIEDPSVATHASIEYMEVVNRVMVEGPCQIQQRWYTNGVTPRTYFISGATAYNKSKYMKDLWNSLTDELEASNRFNRTNISRLHFDGVKQGVFYDLTSFTSNMAVQRRFLDVLGLYCVGTEITVVDGRHGPVNVDLGEMVLEYNKLNWMPEYTTDLFSPYGLDVFHHGVGGFLGVFGNIATCTFLHAAFLLQLVDHANECSCAGDDAIAFVEDEATIWACVPLLGILAPEKSFLLTDIDVVYLKRRTWMNFREYQLRQKAYVQLPSFLTHVDKKTLSRFRESSYSKPELVELAAQSLSSTFRSMARVFSQQSVFEEGVNFCTAYYDLMGFPHEGNIPQFTNSVVGLRSKLIPALDTLGSHHYISETIISLYPGRVSLPRREEPQDNEIIPRKGTRFQTVPNKQLTYLKRLGYISEGRKVHDLYTGDTGLAKLLEEFDNTIRKPPAIIIYTVEKDLPGFLLNGTIDIRGAYDFDFSYMYHKDTPGPDPSEHNYLPPGEYDEDIEFSDDDLDA